jgi:hypothetical protein
MKIIILKIGAFVLLFSMMGAGCEKEKTISLKDKALNVSSMSYSSCKETLVSNTIEQYIELKAIGKNQLQIKFINASLNCCPEEIYSNAYIKNNLLRINFREKTPAECNCNCYYDLECIIDSLEDREYTTEVYAHGDSPKARFTFSFSDKLDAKINITNN